MSNNPRGRPKGSLNTKNVILKDMILQALDKVGGAEYLFNQALCNPTAFMTLLGKILPLDVNSNVDGKLTITWEK